MEVVDRYTVKFLLKEPYGWSMGWLTRNLKTVFKRNPDYFLPGLP